MMRPDIHVALVSAQAVPNITPVLDPSFQPSEVVLVVSPDMEQRAEWLMQVLRPRGVKLSRWPITDAWDIRHVSERVWQLLELREGDDIALNATGGTKPMSIAAYEAFRDWDRPIFYVHPEKDEVIWMHPSGEESFHLANRIRLEHFLQAYGATVEGAGRTRSAPIHLLELAEELVNGVDRHGRALGNLNWLASSASDPHLKSEPMTPEQLKDPDLLDLIDRLEPEGLLRFEHGRLVFPDPDARFFVSGGWLEEHVYSVVSRLRADVPLIQDLGRSIKVCRQGARGPVKNELDVVFLADNRLYVIECKTRHWRGPGQHGPGAEALYKLDTLKELLGGLQARAMLVSYRDLPDADRRRAGDLNIEVCAGTQVRRFPELLKRWTAA